MLILEFGIIGRWFFPSRNMIRVKSDHLFVVMIEPFLEQPWLNLKFDTILKAATFMCHALSKLKYYLDRKFWNLFPPH